MAKIFSKLSDELVTFIEAQKIFFVATAAETGNVNLSPKGMDTLRVVDKNKIIWLNLTGSGNETAAHLLKVNRMTIMFCSFDGKPLILRLYGTAKVYHERDDRFNDLLDLFPMQVGSRQIFEMNINQVQTSCGYAVPFMDFKEERTQLKSWAEKQGPEKIKDYWKEKNTLSIDDFETGIFG
jgi:hypothetical protein